MKPTVVTVSQIPESKSSSLLDQARSIFIETSKGYERLSDPERVSLERRYFGAYLDHPKTFYLALNEEKVMGYLAGAEKTLPLHFKLNPYLLNFKTEIENRFQAHLHLNLTRSARGQGLGSGLIEAFESELRKSRTARGFHIVTAKGAENVNFYLKNGLTEIQSRGNLLLMGKAL
jgi:GNAT superfamily N-acetyltransferase